MFSPARRISSILSRQTVGSRSTVQWKRSFSASVRARSDANEEPFVVVSKDKEDPSVVIITFNRPKNLNALSQNLGDSFKNVIEDISTKTDGSVRCVVVTGAGRAFSAGGDLDFLQKRQVTASEENSRTMLAFYKRFLHVRTLPVPVIACINGPAVGAGMCLTLACDMRVAAKDAKMSVNFVRLGLHPGMASTHFLAKICGPQQASRLLLTGETITGEEAKDLGIVVDAVEKEQVLERALVLARSVAAAAPEAVRATVRSLRLQQDVGMEQAIQREADAQAHSYTSADYKEGISAIIERRKPNF
eukprot:TRINITY_DN2542_c0_g1_i1.p1 TRINITY_DN2542_c0_g1~~TRINITY_DN2542_c0_g1_i1.p1  ORF type:complete len:313 (+),score=40.85 TRINITY_DN2542_c0_g1_i1:29-940(+)